MRAALTTFLLSLLLTSISNLYALNPDKAISQYVHNIWGKEQGLPQLSVRTLAQTNDGYLWIGTDNGLARFDGIRFAVFDPRTGKNVNSGSIIKLFKDLKGRLWISMNTGELILYENNLFIDYGRKLGIDNVRSITQDSKGTIWLGSTTAIGAVEKDRFVPLKSKSGFMPKLKFPILFDHAGNLWVESYLWIDSEFKRAPEFPTTIPVISIFEDSAKTIWFGTEGQGLVFYRNGEFGTIPGLPSNTVVTIGEDRDHSLWIGTQNGITRLSGGSLQSFNSKQGLSEDQVKAVLEDTEGNLWIGTQGGGLNRLHDGPVTPYSTIEGMSQNAPFCIYEDHNSVLWIGSTQGLDRFENGKFSFYTPKDGLPSNEVLSMWGDHENVLWLGTSGGLSKFENGKFTTYSKDDGLSSNVILSIFEDSNHLLWIGTTDGIFQYDRSRFTTIYTPPIRHAVSSIVETTDGSIWASAGSKGMLRFQNGKRSDYTIKDGLSSDWVITLHADRDGNLWIGTYNGGLNRYRNGKFTQYTTAAGLHNEAIYRILEDDRENLWMSSNEGIFRVSKKELNDFADSKISRINSVAYGKPEGMRNVECNGGQQPAGWKTRGGILWFPTAEGIVRIDPNNLIVNQSILPVHLEELIVDGTNRISLEKKNSSVSIPPGEGKLEFHYTALSFSSPERIRFEYMLEGFDKKWVDGSNQRTAYYTNISPGNYIFRVKAANSDGIWNEAGASLSLYLQPHFYQTYWFYALCLVAVGYAGFRIHRYQLNRALELEQIRTRIATDLHDDIGAGLTQIAILSEVLQRRPEAETEAADGFYSRNQSLERIAESSRELIDSMSDIVWAVDPQKDRVLDLVLRMRRFANDLLGGKNIRFTFHTDSLEDQRELDPATRKHLYLIFKESVNNIVRHSECTEAAISLQSNSSEMILAIQDNGKGLDSVHSADDRRGHGLNSIRTRAQEMGARLDISGSPTTGTRIELHLPLR